MAAHETGTTLDAEELLEAEIVHEELPGVRVTSADDDLLPRPAYVRRRRLRRWLVAASVAAAVVAVYVALLKFVS